MRQGEPNSSCLPGLSGGTLALLFIIVATLPMMAALISGTEAASALNELGTAFALTATALLFLQFLSSGRYESLSGKVGIDRTMGFHRIAAYVLLAFALLHPLSYCGGMMVTDPIAAWHRLTGMVASPRLWSGTLSLTALIVIVGLATVRSYHFIRYEFWRVSHGLLAIALAVLTLHHAFTVGTYSAEWPLKVIWLLFAILTVIAIGLVYIVRPWRMWRENWRVERVSPLADGVWEMILHGPDDTRLRFSAGQFIWLTLAPNRPPFHDHPFSIASAAADLPRIRLVIREAGDCTNNFGRVEPGTRVAVDGPHGSFILPKVDAPVIMIAGGVGIAPLLGMLEEAAANNDPRSFRLLYAARKPSAFAGMEQLWALQSRLDLSLQCFVDEVTAESRYRAGPLRSEHIAEMLKGTIPERAIALVCGPADMMAFATDALLASGVPASSIRYEHFDYTAGKGRLDRKRRTEALALLLVLVAAMIGFSLRQLFTGLTVQ